MVNAFSIAIDGPAAAGKGTIAPLLAKKLKGFYLNTGAMYRCLALMALEKGFDPQNQTQIIELLSQIEIRFENGKIFLNNKDVTERIKNQDVAIASSKVAVIKQVRQDMVKRQQKITENFIKNGISVIAEGRDTATRVLPNADLKVFLTASVKERAKRRLFQVGLPDNDFNSQKILTEVKDRDKRDSERDVDPLVSDPEKFGYFVLDDTNLSEEETLKKIIEKLNDLH